MKLTVYGRREWLGAALIVCILISILIWLTFFHVIQGKILAVISGCLIVVWFAVAAFFRDPERTVPEEADVIVSPADGVVRDIELIKNESITPNLASISHNAKNAVKIAKRIAITKILLFLLPRKYANLSREISFVFLIVQFPPQPFKPQRKPGAFAPFERR